MRAEGPTRSLDDLRCRRMSPFLLPREQKLVTCGFDGSKQSRVNMAHDQSRHHHGAYTCREAKKEAATTELQYGFSGTD